MKKTVLILIILFITISIFFFGKYINYYKYEDNIYLAILVDGEEENDFPIQDNYEVNISCNNNNVKWDYDNWKLKISNITKKIKCAVSFKSLNPPNLASHIISLTGTDQGNGKLINENGYRYQGKSPNNWIMFNNEYWRIIGVFDQNTHGKTDQNLVKIIREDSIGGIAWHKENIANWNASSLKALLNNNYYNGINESTITNCYVWNTIVPGNCNFIKDGITNEIYRNMVENVIWRLGGHGTPVATVSTFYTAERGTIVYSGLPTSGEGYIGLMYPSDYGYAVLASDCARTTNLSEYMTADCAGKNWLYDIGEWTLTSNSETGYNVYCSANHGWIVHGIYLTMGNSVRPVLYLKSNVLKLTGDGSFETPYIIVE